MATKIALLQSNPIVGDINGNAVMIQNLANLAYESGAGFAVTTELAISGYPPRDLLLQDDFISRCHQIASDLESPIPILVGTPVPPIQDRSLPGSFFPPMMYLTRLDISRLMRGRGLQEQLQV